MCVHKISGIERAVKLVHKRSLDENQKKSFANEYEIMRRLDHPNIIKLYEVYEDDAYFYLVQEYNFLFNLLRVVKGGELFDELVKRKRF